MADTAPLDVVIIGAGFSGVCAAIKLAENGIANFQVFDKCDGIGGTWWLNTYPGAACDVQSHFYCYSFEMNPDWSRRYAPQPEIQKYIEHCAVKYGVRDRINLGCEITDVTFDEAQSLWITTFSNRAPVKSRFIINGGGGLHQPYVPDFDGLAAFTGTTMHTARWDHSFDPDNKRIAVIGSAASAVQAVPKLAEDAAGVTLFQRTPNYIFPREDAAYTPAEQAGFRTHPQKMEKLRQAIFNDSETRIYPIVKSAVVRKAAATQVKKFIRAQIKDQDLQEKLMPDYEIGCKRMLVSDDFLPALNRKNVTVETRGVARFTADGVVTGDGRTLPFDAVVFATGFDLESHKRGIDVTGQGGVNLKALWQDQSDAYRASMVPSFPNYFLVTGPNAGVGTSSVVYLIEQSVNWIIEVIKTAGRSKLISVSKDACRQFSDNIQQQLGETVWATGCDSWYISPNGRNETLFPGNAQDFAEQMSHVDTDDFIVTDIAGQNDLHPTEWAPLRPQSDKRSIKMRKLDPTLQAILFSEEARNAPDMTQMSPDGARAYYKAMVAKLESTISIPAQTEDGVMDLTDRSLSYRIYRPDTDATKAPALVFFHGGGMMVGDLDTHDNPCRAIVKRSGVCIISVEYRLAPEHRFPTAAEDGYDAFCWVVENADTLGIDPEHVAIGGDSAGGNVSAAVTLMLRDRGGPACAAQLLIYPAVGPEKDTGSLVELASGYGLDRDLIDWFNGNYAPSLVDRADIRVSPLRAKTHANLPPAIVITAGFDPLRDEGLAYAEQLKACGVSVQYREYPDLIHGFLSWVGVIPSAQNALNEIADLLATAFPVTASANI